MDILTVRVSLYQKSGTLSSELWLTSPNEMSLVPATRSLIQDRIVVMRAIGNFRILAILPVGR